MFDLQCSGTWSQKHTIGTGQIASLCKLFFLIGQDFFISAKAVREASRDTRRDEEVSRALFRVVIIPVTASRGRQSELRLNLLG